MVILQVNIDSVGLIPAEGNAPVPCDADRPTVRAAESVKIVTRQIQLLRFGSRIEGSQDTSDPRRIRHAQPTRVAGREVAAQRPVAEGAYHATKMAGGCRGVKYCFT